MRLGRTAVAGSVLGVGLLASVSSAGQLEPDGIDLRADLPGGVAVLELEDRGARPAICFGWKADAPQDGDSIASRVLTRDGTEVVDLGAGDQWVDGAAEGCEIPRDDRYREVFADPGRYVVEFVVVEEQGTAPTGPVRSGPLERT